MLRAVERSAGDSNVLVDRGDERLCGDAEHVSVAWGRRGAESDEACVSIVCRASGAGPTEACHHTFSNGRDMRYADLEALVGYVHV